MKYDVVKCMTCGNVEKVNFSYCLRNGWPKCCGYTMRLMTNPTEDEIDDAVKDALGNAPNILRRFSSE